MQLPAILSIFRRGNDEHKVEKTKQDNKPRFGWRHMRWPAFVLVLIVIEYPLTVAALALTGIADPDTYRTKLWKDGSLNGFNSDPATPLLAAANYRPVTVPLVWSSGLTQFNLVIAVLSMFWLLVKNCLILVAWLSPALSLIIHGLLVGLYGYSLYGQTSHDTIDKIHQNGGAPWYITKSCSVVFYPSNYGYCQQAKALFYVFIFLLLLFVLNFLVAVFSVAFAPLHREDEESPAEIIKRRYRAKRSSREMRTMRESNWLRERQWEQERQWEMVPVPDTPGTMAGMKSPMTPRTTAFNALEGGGRSAPGGHFPPPPKGKKRFF